MFQQVGHLYALVFMRLKTFKKEETDFNGRSFALHAHFVPTVVDLTDQLAHFVAMERRYAHKHFIENDAESPRIDCVVVTTALDNLRGLVEWRANN